VGTNVLVYDGHDWEHKCWSARGTSRYGSAGILKSMFYPSAAGILTLLK
jgi:hypothetical protein